LKIQRGLPLWCMPQPRSPCGVQEHKLRENVLTKEQACVDGFEVWLCSDTRSAQAAHENITADPYADASRHRLTWCATWTELLDLLDEKARLQRCAHMSICLAKCFRHLCHPGIVHMVAPPKLGPRCRRRRHLVQARLLGQSSAGRLPGIRGRRFLGRRQASVPAPQLAQPHASPISTAFSSSLALAAALQSVSTMPHSRARQRTAQHQHVEHGTARHDTRSSQPTRQPSLLMCVLQGGVHGPWALRAHKRVRAQRGRQAGPPPTGHQAGLPAPAQGQGG